MPSWVGPDFIKPKVPMTVWTSIYHILYTRTNILCANIKFNLINIWIRTYKKINK